MVAARDSVSSLGDVFFYDENRLIEEFVGWRGVNGGDEILKGVC